MFPAVYAETVAKGKRGELGAELQKFLLEHPDGAIDASNVVGVCKKCGALENLIDLSMYLPTEGYTPEKPKGRWSVAFPADDIDYVAPSDLQGDYALFARYPHRCKQCGGEMKIFTEETIGRIKCPRCKLRLEETGGILWD